MDTLNRRAGVAGALASTAALALAAVPTGAAAPSPELIALVEGLKFAFTAETGAYRAAKPDDPDDACDGATSTAWKSLRALLALDPASISPGDRDLYRIGIAAGLRWSLVSEGAYLSDHPDELVAVRLADLTLAGTDFDRIPWLWHENGQLLESKPAPVALKLPD